MNTALINLLTFSKGFGRQQVESCDEPIEVQYVTPPSSEASSGLYCEGFIYFGSCQEGPRYLNIGTARYLYQGAARDLYSVVDLEIDL